MRKLFLFIGLFIACTSFTQMANDESLIQSINDMNTTWTAGESERFKGYTMESVRKLVGTRKMPKSERKKVKTRKIEPRFDLPHQFDLREQYPKCESIKEISDQGNCGACWAFSAAGAMSDRLCIQSKQKLQTRVSAAHLLSCCVYCNGCWGGGYMINPFKYWFKSGLPTGGAYGTKKTCRPYGFPPCEHGIPGSHPQCEERFKPTPKCTETCIPEYPKSLAEDLSFATDYYWVGKNERMIMTEIYEKGSVAADFVMYEDFIVYKKGVYQHVKGERIDIHATKIIGWGEENGVDYWLCVNSWNDNWGDKGTFKIMRGWNHLNIEDGAAAAAPKLNMEEMSFIE